MAPDPIRKWIGISSCRAGSDVHVYTPHADGRGFCGFRSISPCGLMVSRSGILQHILTVASIAQRGMGQALSLNELRYNPLALCISLADLACSFNVKCPRFADSALRNCSRHFKPLRHKKIGRRDGLRDYYPELRFNH
jgi:hypothetical protein